MCLVEIPAVYETVSKHVLVAKATTRTVEVSPAVYETVKKTVLKSAATTMEIPIPAEYRIVEVTREISPETTLEIPIPEEYGTVSVTRLVAPASEQRTQIPAEYVTVKTNRKKTPERIKWLPVLCEINMTRENVIALQTALNETGSCRCGPNRNECQADGIIGQCTLKAAQRFAERERSKKLSWGSNYIDLFEALRMLCTRGNTCRV